jgi:hypothetical protein
MSDDEISAIDVERYVNKEVRDPFPPGSFLNVLLQKEALIRSLLMGRRGPYSNRIVLGSTYPKDDTSDE